MCPSSHTARADLTLCRSSPHGFRAAASSSSRGETELAEGVVTKATEAQLEPPSAGDRAPATAAVVAAAAIGAVVFVVRR